MTQIWNNLPITDTTQGVTGSGTAAATTSTNPADYLVEMITDLVIGLESQANAGAGTSTTTVLPSAAEPSTSSALDVDPSALAMMGDAVGVGMASASTSVDWNSFVQQTTQQFTAAGLSPTDIDTYLGAVMQGFGQGDASVGLSTSIGASANPGPSVALPSPSVAAGVAAPASTAVAGTGTQATAHAVSTSSYAVDPSQLPDKRAAAVQYTNLGEAAFNQAAPSLGSQVDINLYVANTQAEMSNDGYTQEQINNYMTGLYTAYNASPAGALPSSNTDTTTTVQQPTDDENT